MKLNTINNSKYSKFFTRIISLSFVFIASIIIALTYYETAHAGLSSLVYSIFGSEVSASSNKKSSSGNSQTIAVLAAASNRDPNPDKSFETVPVNDDQILVADLASTNTIADTSNTQISIYTVREGDTLSGVAKMFKVSINTILWANDLNGKSVLRSGQKLVILPISGINYTIKSGDTLKGIALRYGTDIDDILNYNDLTLSSKLSVGQTIIIPDAEGGIAKAISTNTKPISTTLMSSTNLRSIPGYFIRPVVGGYRSQTVHGHNGVDIAAPVGTSLLASAAGTVIINKVNGAWNGGYGNYIVISHPNGTQTLYSHLSKSYVGIGQEVYQGQKIGTIGMTGLTTGPHVHFEIRGAKNPF